MVALTGRVERCLAADVAAVLHAIELDLAGRFVARAMAISYDAPSPLPSAPARPKVTRSLPRLFDAGIEDLRVRTIAGDIVEAVDHIAGSNIAGIPVSR